jgi:hypothetical protein
MADPIEVTGTIRFSADGISVDLDTHSREAVAARVEDGQPVRLVMWDERPLAERSLVEQIGETQQLDRSIIAKALLSKGAISDKQDFLSRID